MNEREIRDLLRERGETVSGVCARLGVTRALGWELFRYGPGRRWTKRYALAKEIARVLGRPFEEVWGNDKEAA